MKRIDISLAVIGIMCLFITTEALAFVVQETDYEIPNETWVPPYVFPEFAPAGFSFVREYNSETLNDGWVGFGWTWDVIGLKGFASGIASFIEGLSASTDVILGDGSKWEFDLTTSRIDFSYFDITSSLLGTFRLEFNADDRILRFTDYLGYITVFNYSAPAGDLVSAVDFLGNTIQYEYDANHRLRTRIGPEGDRTDFPIPEPTSLALLSLGIAGIGYQWRRKAGQ